ncbi:MAG: type IX secretion system sortase PorU [candidate division Zixibacteria bacterium]|nr:type IX secretion system sortase PorU [candidate division Zixibacteria bacterium]
MGSAAFVHSAPRSIEIISSGSNDISFVRHFAGLSDLTRTILPDSTITYLTTVQIGMPVGSTARLISANGNGLQGADDLIGDISSNLPLAELSTPRAIRGRQILAVRICPVVGNAFYETVEVRIAFEGGAAASGRQAADPLFDRIFSSSLINFDQAQGWYAHDQRSAASIAAESNPFEVTADWLKLSVRQTGLYRVTGAQLQANGFSLTNLRSDSIRVFNGGGKPAAIRNEDPRPEFTELAVYIEDGGDGIFGSADALYFFGEAPNRFVHEAGGIDSWLNNVYFDQNIYWLTIASGGFSGPSARMAVASGAPTGMQDTTITTIRRRVHVEQDQVLLEDASNHINDYYKWYWTDQRTLSMFVPTPGVVAGDSALLYLEGKTGVSGSGSYMTVSINGTAGLNPIRTGNFCRFGTKALVDGLNDIDISLTPISSTVAPYFDFIEISYLSRILPASNQVELVIDSVAARGLIEIQDNFTVAPLVLDLTDPLHPVRVTGYTRAGGSLSFETQLEADGINRFFASVAAVALTPSSFQRVSPLALRGTSEQTDLIVVTPASLITGMDEYVAYREAEGYSIKVVSLEAIYDNFSWGMADPTAIRDYLKFAYETYPAPAPAAVLFVGDANYDWLNRLGTGVANFVPTYINPLEGGFIGSSYSDDNYVYFGDYGILDSDRSYLQNDRGFDMMSARWPVRSRAEIANIVAKIKRYEARDDFGTWRTNVTLVADDEFGQFSTETFHATQTEELQRAHLPAHFMREKIYLWDYPFVNSEKPAVNAAIVDAINQGTLLVNYVGHGNPDVWAHEHVLTRGGDLPKLRDLDRLPLIFAASCAIGFFDDPLRQAMGEDFMTMSGGGAIGVISATRLVFSSDNAAFNRQVFDILMYEDSISICQALYAGKMLRQYGNDTIPQPEDNDRAYVYFGDPLLKLGMPRLQIEFTSSPDSLMALGKSQVSGKIVDRSGLPVNLNGELVLTVFDSDRDRTYRLVNSSGQVTQEVSYKLTGPTLFRGTAAISSGEFNAEFISPLDISFGRTGARVLAYAILDTIDAVGLVDSLPVASQVAVSTDSVGPVITYAISGRPNFADGDYIWLQDSLLITIQDSSGVNVAEGLGHGISLTIDDRTDQTTDLSDAFSYDQNSFTQGRLAYPLASLAQGAHTFKIKAWDNANNSSSVQFSATVANPGRLAIQDLLNYPNPMQAQTTFYFELTEDVQRMTVDIFTVAGRKIKSFTGQNLTASTYPNESFRVVWDGRDTAGDRVATGVYIYKALAIPTAGGDAVESFGKIVVIN